MSSSFTSHGGGGGGSSSRDLLSSHRTVTTGTSSVSDDSRRQKSQRSKSGNGSVVVVWGSEEPAAPEPKERDYSLEVVREPPPLEEEEKEKGLFRYRNILLAVLVVAAIVTTVVVVVVGGGGQSDKSATTSSAVNNPDSPSSSNSSSDVFQETKSPVVATSTPTVAATEGPTAAPTAWKLTCGCKDCIQDILQRDARGETCEERIMKEMNDGGLEEMEACFKVATYYPIECGPHCHPAKCDGQAPAHCSCQECTTELFDSYAGAFTCREYMLLKMSQLKITEEEACLITAERFPDICGIGCNPSTCPSNNVPKEPEPERCGCASCDEQAWNAPAGADATCGERITWLTSKIGGELNSTWACIQIANSEFPEDCGACNPMTCHENDQAAAVQPQEDPTFCGCPNCVPDKMDRDADGVTCANRIAWLQTPIGKSHNEIDACIKTQQDWPAYCSRACDPSQCHDLQPMCGCASCTEQVLQLDADGHTCAERIFFLISEQGGSNSERDACRMIAGQGRNYNRICGACDPENC